MLIRRALGLGREILKAARPNEKAMRFSQFLKQTSPGTRRLGGPEVLVILANIPTFHIGVSQAAPLLAERHSARIVAFSTSFSHSKGFGLAVGWLVQRFERLNRGNLYSIFRGFGVSRFVTPRISRRAARKAGEDLASLKKLAKSAEELERATIRGVLVGDLIYDQHLLENKQVSLDPADPNFWQIAERGLKLLYFFERYFDRHHIVAVFGNNAYLNAIPNRIALSRNIPVFEVGLQLTRVGTPDEPTYFADFPTEFRKIQSKTFTTEYGLAKKYLDEFTSGQPVTPLYGHSFASFQGRPEESTLRRQGKKPTVLVAPHNAFTDSPHVLGFSLFPDYGAWLDFLATLAKEVEFTWLIKPHPDKRDPQVYEANSTWIRNFAAKNRQFELIPDDTPHSELIASGIDTVLTVSGSIAFEYAACGIPVINACPSNPHAAYSFTASPQSIDEYVRLVRQIPIKGMAINKEEVAEFFYMRMFESAKSPFFADPHALSNALGGVFNFDSAELYDHFVSDYSESSRELSRRSIQAFYDSGDRYWYERHRASAKQR